MRKLITHENQDGAFLKYYLDSNYVIKKMQQEAKGTTQKFVGLGYLRNFPIALPPLPEQERIVVVLDEAFEGIDAAIANTEQNLANTHELFASKFIDVFQCPDRNQETVHLSSLCDFIVDCEHKTAPVQAEGIPSIRTPNIGFGELLLDDVNRVSEETYEIWTRRGKPRSGDLILAREAPAGNIAVIPEGKRVCLGQRTVLIRPKKDIIVSEYLAYLILHPVMQEELLGHSKGATVQHINMKDIRAFPIGKLPSKIEQEKYSDTTKRLFRRSRELESIYKKKLTALAELKQSLLGKAFSGELTADSEPVLKEAVG